VGRLVEATAVHTFQPGLWLTVLQALVESHKYHAAESIDDVIQGKGKGLVGK